MQLLAGFRQMDVSEVSVSNCTKWPCKLKKGTTRTVEMKLTPDKDLKRVTNHVQAIIASIPLPFIGVDGTSACNQIFAEDGVTKAGCPLKAGQTYIYRNSFDVLNFYPSLALVVHYAVQSGNKDIACFEVPARIQ